MKIFRIIAVICFALYNPAICAAGAKTKPPTEVITNPQTACLGLKDKRVLETAWYTWKPYQYENRNSKTNALRGMDIEIIQNIASSVGIELRYDEVQWAQQQEDIVSGKQDMASGVTYSDERAKFGYFSAPYRFEENSLFVLKNSERRLSFTSVPEFLAQVRLRNFYLGVINGFTYGSKQINDFVKDAGNQDIVFAFDSEEDALNALLLRDIYGFITDRVVGASIILNKSTYSDKVKEVVLNVKTPIHLLFSKKTVPLELVDQFNKETRKFTETEKYKGIIKAYFYPVLLLKAIDSQWFYFVGMIGTIAFAISGIAIATKENSSLFGTFLFAMLPSVAGSIMRDVIINRDEVGIILTPSYIYYILMTVLVGVASIRLLGYYNKESENDPTVEAFWNNVLVVGDAVGQAAFIVTGVAIVVMVRIEPIALWGPFFAFLTSNGGCIIRDLIRKDKNITSITEGINAEVSVIWGLGFSLFLNTNIHTPNPTSIKYAMITVATGAFLSRIALYYLKIPNIKFR